jgi:hypothetical protein
MRESMVLFKAQCKQELDLQKSKLIEVHQVSVAKAETTNSE